MRRVVEVPERGEVRDAGLVPQIVEERTIGGVAPRRGGQALADGGEPLGIAQTRIALEGFLAGRILLVEALRLQELPVLGPIGEEAMVGGVEIGGNVLHVPSHVVLDEGLGRRLLAAPIHGGARGDSDFLQGGVLLGRLCLPHDDLVVPPGGLRRPSNEPGLCLLLPYGAPSLRIRRQREPDREPIAYSHGAPEIQRESHVQAVTEVDGNRALLDEATVDIGPGDDQGASARGRSVYPISRLDLDVAIQGRGGQHDLAAPGYRRPENENDVQDQPAHSPPSFWCRNEISTRPWSSRFS